MLAPSWLKERGKQTLFHGPWKEKYIRNSPNDWNGRVTVNYCQRNHISAFYDVCIKVYMFANRYLFQCSQVWKECIKQTRCIFTRQNCCQRENLNPMLPAELGTESLLHEIWLPALYWERKGLSLREIKFCIISNILLNLEGEPPLLWETS